MIALIVWSQLQSASTPAFLNKCMNAFSPSSKVAKPLCGISGSSGRFGLAGRMLPEEKGRAEPGSATVPFVPFARFVEVGVVGSVDGSVAFWAAGGAAAGLEEKSLHKPMQHKRTALHATGQHELATLGLFLNLLQKQQEFIWHIPLGLFAFSLDIYI